MSPGAHGANDQCQCCCWPDSVSQHHSALRWCNSKYFYNLALISKICPLDQQELQMTSLSLTLIFLSQYSGPHLAPLTTVKTATLYWKWRLFVVANYFYDYGCLYLTDEWRDPSVTHVTNVTLACTGAHVHTWLSEIERCEQIRSQPTCISISKLLK